MAMVTPEVPTFFCADVDDVDGLGAEVGGHVGDEDAGFVCRVRVVLELDAVDGLVGADVEEGGVRVLGDGGGGREGGVLAVLAGPGEGGGGELVGLLEGLVAPGAGDEEVGGSLSGTAKNWVCAPPCRKSTSWVSGTAKSARRSASALLMVASISFPRWLISMMLIPEPR
jgi:hypothetical protein